MNKNMLYRSIPKVDVLLENPEYSNVNRKSSQRCGG